MARKPRHTLAARIMARLDQLATLSASAGEITRLYLTNEHRAAADLVAGWMREAGLSVTLDSAGTVVGRTEGSVSNARTLLVGSHIDTVRNAGRYDGCLGVVLAIEAMAELQRLGRKLPYAVEVLAFGDEEGVRFPRTLNGSRAIAGLLDGDVLEMADANGVDLASALRAFGCDPAKLLKIGREPTSILGYVEVHIEQGPVLEKQGLAVGVVTAISGASRLLVEVTGKAGHAGTVPMPQRRDALSGAAEMVLAVERTARDTAGLVATVGRIEALPGAVNVVPGGAVFTLDIRSPVDRTRRYGFRQIEQEMRAIARRRQLTLRLTETYNEPSAICDQRIISHFSAAMDTLGQAEFGLPSGAGHDGLAMVKLCPIGMLFVRCKGGISHHPDESVKADDVEVATRTLMAFLDRFSTDGRTIG
jgi:allantoate deiminase